MNSLRFNTEGAAAAKASAATSPLNMLVGHLHQDHKQHSIIAKGNGVVTFWALNVLYSVFLGHTNIVTSQTLSPAPSLVA